MKLKKSTQVKNTLFLSAFMLLGVFHASAQTTDVSGSVFKDENRNRIINTGESFTTLPAPLYVYLVSTTNIIIDSAHVAPNGTYVVQAPSTANYSLHLSTQQYAISTNVSSAPINNTPPTGYATTGENATNNNTGTGDFSPDGIILNLTVMSSPLTNRNFGIACSVAGTGNNYDICASEPSVMPLFAFLTNADPGGVWTLQSGGTGVLFDATAATIQLTSSAVTSSYLYSITGVAGCPSTSSIATATIAPVPVTNQNITICAGDTLCVENSGTNSRSIGFNEKVCYTTSGTYSDTLIAASQFGCDSIVITNLTVEACGSLTITGSVFNDANGNTIIDAGENFATLPTAMYAYLVNSHNVVVDSTVIAANGTYSLQAQPNQTYTIKVSAQQYQLGANTVETPISNTQPSGWVVTGEHGNNNTGPGDGVPDGALTVVVGTVNINNQNFGIEQIPNTDTKLYNMPNQPVSGSSISLNGLAGQAPIMTGNDPEDGVYNGNIGTVRNPSGVVIASLPTNGELYYDGVLVTSAQITANTLFTDPSKFSFKFTGSAYNTTTFQYAYVDAAGVKDPTPATYTISWGSPLPIDLLNFEAYKNNNSVELIWTTSNEINHYGFDVEKSENGNNWKTIGFVEATHENNNEPKNYSLIDKHPSSGMNYYRLKQLDLDGAFNYSQIKIVRFEKMNSLRIVPNPTIADFEIIGLQGSNAITLTNLAGKVLINTKTEGIDRKSFKIDHLPAGMYFIAIKNPNGNSEVHKLIKK